MTLSEIGERLYFAPRAYGTGLLVLFLSVVSPSPVVAKRSPCNQNADNCGTCLTTGAGTFSPAVGQTKVFQGCRWNPAGRGHKKCRMLLGGTAEEKEKFKSEARRARWLVDLNECPGRVRAITVRPAKGRSADSRSSKGVCSRRAPAKCITSTRECLVEKGQCVGILRAASLNPPRAIRESYPNLIKLRQNNLAGPILSEENNQIVAQYLRERGGEVADLRELDVAALGRQLRTHLAHGIGSCLRKERHPKELESDGLAQGEARDALRVGWALSSDSAANGAITYSFEKEFVGYADGFPRLYWPNETKEPRMGYSECRALWLIVHALAPQVLARAVSHDAGGFLDDWEQWGGLMPLSRHPQAPQWIRSSPEDDSGPLELKMASFSYSQQLLFEELRGLLPLLDVPRIRESDGLMPAQKPFPGERRVQVHVSVPFARQAPPGSRDKSAFISKDEELRKQFYSVGIYMSDYLSLRAFYNTRGAYSPLAGEVPTQTYIADLITDEHNSPWQVSQLRELFERDKVRRGVVGAPPQWLAPTFVYGKEHPVGLRIAATYMGGVKYEERGPTIASPIPYRLGFEFRKGWKDLNELQALVSKMSAVFSQMRAGDNNDSVVLRLGRRDVSVANIREYVNRRTRAGLPAKQEAFVRALSKEALFDLTILAIYLDKEKGWKVFDREYIYAEGSRAQRVSSTFESVFGITGRPRGFQRQIIRTLEFLFTTPWEAVLGLKRGVLKHATFVNLSGAFGALQQALRGAGIDASWINPRIYTENLDFPPKVDRALKTFLGEMVKAANELHPHY